MQIREKLANDISKLAAEKQAVKFNPTHINAPSQGLMASIKQKLLGTPAPKIPIPSHLSDKDISFMTEHALSQIPKFDDKLRQAMPFMLRGNAEAEARALLRQSAEPFFKFLAKQDPEFFAARLATTPGYAGRFIRDIS